MKCIYCKTEIVREFLDLGAQPCANALLQSPDEVEAIYPLKFVYCNYCQLFQRGVTCDIPLFDSSYPYRTGTSKSYVEQCIKLGRQDFTRFKFDKDTTILEIGANDGSVLEYFKKEDCLVLGVDPTHDGSKGYIHRDFFTYEKSKMMPNFDYIYALNVAAHVPNLHDFIEGIANCMNDKSILVIENAATEDLLEKSAWDTIYHEHFAYFTAHALDMTFLKSGLYLFDIKHLKSHGGSWRAYYSKNPKLYTPQPEFSPTRAEHLYKNFVNEKERWLGFFYHHYTRRNSPLTLFGAAAKGITFINSLGLKSDIIPFCVDETPEKVGKYMPQSKVPIYSVDKLKSAHQVVNLAWNHKKEIEKKFPDIKFIHAR